MSEAAGPERDTFFRRTLAGVIAVCSLAFAVLVALIAYAPELRDGSDGGGHALSRSAIGFGGLARLLKETGAPVVISRGPLPPPTGAPGLLVLTPPAGTEAKVFNALGQDRAMLVVLPKWSPTPDPLHAGWVHKAGLADAAAAVTALSGRATLSLQRRRGSATPALVVQGGPFDPNAPWRIGAVEAFQTLKPSPGLRPLVVDETGGVLVGRLPGQPALTVLADPDLVDTFGLKSLGRARAAVDLIDGLRGEQGPVVFDVTLNGFKRTRSLLRLALGPPFLAATLCALAAGLLMTAHGLVRFGPAQRGERALPLGKRALADNTAVLIRLARREPKMGAPYAALTRRALLQAAGLRRDVGAEAAERALDGLTRPGERPFSALVAAAQGARTTAELTTAAHDLHQRRRDLTREHR